MPKPESELARFWALVMAAFCALGSGTLSRPTRRISRFCCQCSRASASHSGVRLWWHGRRGLGQWPNPHGRYYTEWLSLSKGHGDYYQWLAARKNNREPWRTWAARERNEG
jgi:hypothetical protein